MHVFYSKKIFTILLIFLLAFFSDKAVAQTILGWNTDTVPDNTYGPSPWTPATLNAQLLTSGLIRGSSITYNPIIIPADFCWGGSGGWSTAQSDANSFYFTFQARPGYKVNLTTISSATRRSATGPSGVKVYYSVDGSAFVEVANWSTTSTSGTTGTPNSTTLSGIAALQNVAAGKVIKFRLIPQGSTGNYYITGNTNSLQINGTVVPATVVTSVMSGTAPICAGESASLQVAITGGRSPYQLVYTNGVTPVTINNYTSGANIPVSPAGTTTYSVVSVTDADGIVSTGNTGSATITVNPLPTVTATNITTCATGGVTLTGGSPAGGTYSIPNPYFGPTTTFTYSYTDGKNCSKTSSTYTFTRNTPITITDQPSTASQTTCINMPFDPVSVAVTGSGPISYQWYRNTTASTTGGTPAETVRGARTATYSPSSAVVGTLYYYVRITNSCGTVQSIATTGAFTVESQTVVGAVSNHQVICAGSVPEDFTVSGFSGNVVRWQLSTSEDFTTGVQNIAVANAVLPGTTVGNIIQTSYIRALVQNGSCALSPTLPVEITVKSTTWNGSWSSGPPDAFTSVIFASDFNSTTNLEACSVVVNSGNVVFNANHTLKIQNALRVNGGTITFKNDASLVQVNDVVNTGNIRYERDSNLMVAYDYTYWSSPVDFQLLSNFSPNTRFDKYFWWSAITNEWMMVATPSLTPMSIGTGYIIRAPYTFDATPQAFEGAFTGIPNNGTYPVSINIHDAENNSNLIGNPYPSAISADLFMSDPDNAAAIGTGSSMYFWTHNTPIGNHIYTANDYAVYNYTGSIGTTPSAGPNNNRPNGFIAAGQAFMISGLSNGTAYFKNSMRIGANNDQFFKTAIPVPGLERSRMWLEIKNQSGAFKELLIGYVSDATNGIDRGFDADFYESDNSVGFYSLAQDKKLAIQGRALPFSESDFVPLGFNVPIAGSYEIALSDFDGLFANQSIYLEDKLTGVIHNLKQSNYSFESAAGNFNSRFVIRYTNTLLQVDELVVDQDQIIIYKNNNQIIINSAASEILNATIFDMTGRILYQNQHVNAKQTHFYTADLTAVLLVRVTLKNGQTFTQKFQN